MVVSPVVLPWFLALLAATRLVVPAGLRLPGVFAGLLPSLSWLLALVGLVPLALLVVTLALLTHGTPPPLLGGY